jgi:hypothetical protein
MPLRHIVSTAPRIAHPLTIDARPHKHPHVGLWAPVKPPKIKISLKISTFLCKFRHFDQRSPKFRSKLVSFGARPKSSEKIDQTLVRGKASSGAGAGGVVVGCWRWCCEEYSRMPRDMRAQSMSPAAAGAKSRDIQMHALKKNLGSQGPLWGTEGGLPILRSCERE